MKKIGEETSNVRTTEYTQCGSVCNRQQRKTPLGLAGYRRAQLNKHVRGNVEPSATPRSSEGEITGEKIVFNRIVITLLLKT